jgi:hypothetical protein
MIDQFSKEDFESYLASTHSPFTPLGLIDGEYTYSLPLDNQVSITIRSSVKSNGLSADVASDSIRCWLVSGDKPIGGKGRVHRQPGWQGRLTEKVKQLVLSRTLAGDCKECGHPKGIFRARTEANKGRPFARCREHNGFVWLDEPIKTSDIYFSEESCENDSNKNDSNRSDTVRLVALSKQDEKVNTVRVENTQKSQTTTSQQEFSNVPDLPKEEEANRTSAKNPNSQQRQAIEADTKANLRVLAGPGSGKTFVIEHRYKFLVENGVDPDKIIVCTFGKQSATDMGQRIQATCPQANLEQICTINAFCYRLLAKWYPDSRWYQWTGPKDWKIKKTLEDAIGLVWQEKEKPNAQEVYNFINTSKYHGLTTDDSYLWFVDALGEQHGAWLYDIRSKFDAWLNRNRFLTFADQLFLVEQQLKNDANWRAMVQERFSHVVIDEGQDTNLTAMRILITISLEPGQNAVYESEVE